MSKSKDAKRKAQRTLDRQSEAKRLRAKEKRLTRRQNQLARELAQMDKIREETRPPKGELLAAFLRGEPHPKDNLYAPWFEELLGKEEKTLGHEGKEELARREAERSRRIARRDRAVAVLSSTKKWDWGKDELKSLELLVGVPWIRPLEDFKPKGRSQFTLRVSLFEHLLCKYKVPRFLLVAAASQPGHPQVVHLYGPRPEGLPPMMAASPFTLLAHLGQGGRVADLAGLPKTLTKRMCHLFTQYARPDWATGSAVVEAVRWAQVQAFEGDAGTFRALVLTNYLSELRAAPHEEFILTWIQWVCRQGMLAPSAIGPLTDYVQMMRNQDPRYSVVGRTLQSLERATERWHRELAQVRALPHREKPPSEWGSSGLRPKELQVKDEFGNIETYSFEEITSLSRLADEGRLLKHCVVSYARMLGPQHSHSIWSLSKKLTSSVKPTITIQVRSGAIVQAAGATNRRPTPQESRMIKDWAASNNLSWSAR